MADGEFGPVAGRSLQDLKNLISEPISQVPEGSSPVSSVPTLRRRVYR